VAFEHAVVLHVDDVEGDLRALGGAVTTRLCGPWDHVGPCRWPHRSDAIQAGGGARITVGYDAAPDEVEAVRSQVLAALATGYLVGPDGTTTTWGAVHVSG
jgi:hypothetical protein